MEVREHYLGGGKTDYQYYPIVDYLHSVHPTTACWVAHNAAAALVETPILV